MLSETTQVVFSFGRPIIFRKLYSWRIGWLSRHQLFVENEREPRSSQKLNMKSDELRDLAFHQTR
jgi:hypothetical protein